MQNDNNKRDNKNTDSVAPTIRHYVPAAIIQMPAAGEGMNDTGSNNAAIPFADGLDYANGNWWMLLFNLSATGRDPAKASSKFSECKFECTENSRNACCVPNSAFPNGEEADKRRIMPAMIQVKTRPFVCFGKMQA